MKCTDFKDRETIASWRKRALERLGNKCSKTDCTWYHPDVLEIDHIIPVRVTGRGFSRDSNYHIYRTILNMAHPEDEYQILCANHHRLKTVKDKEDLAAAKEEAKGYVDEEPLDGLQNMDE
jgi:hypothetical protein